jgi:hypothetical protein
MGIRWVGLCLLAGPRHFGRVWLLAGAMWLTPLAASPSPRTGWTPASSSPLWPRAKADPTLAVGLGEEYRLGTPGLAGATLVA